MGNAAPEPGGADKRYFSCTCRCSGGKSQPGVGRVNSGVEAEDGIKRVNSFPGRRKECEATQISIARAAAQAIADVHEGRPRLLLPPESLVAPASAEPGAASDCSGTSEEEGGDGADTPAVSAKSSRTPKRRDRKRLTVTQTMGVSPSSALQIIINNPGRLESFYEVDKGKALGQGSFGVVRRAFVRSTRAVRAVKYISTEKMKERVDVLKQEIEIMKAVDHPNIIMLYEIFENHKYLSLVMELCSGGTLQDRVKATGGLGEEQAALAMTQILRAVFYLHRNLICHRDLKAENVLLATPDPLRKTLLKISDFGLSCTFRSNQILTSRVGTLTHMSVEVLDKRYDHLCDIWACGVILYVLVGGSVPWKDEAEIRAGRLPFNGRHWWDASQDVVALVRQLLAKPKNRPAASRALQDAWFYKHLPAPEEPALRFTLLDDLRTYRALNKFKRAALSTVASMLNEDRIAASREIFVSLDSDGDGLFSVAELDGRLRKLRQAGQIDKDLGRAAVERIFRDMDSTSGALKDFIYTEFLAATFNRKECLTDAVCREAFNTFDKSGDGTVDLGELATGRLLGHIPMEELKQTLEELDTNGDSVIDFPEFMDMMRQQS